MCQSYRVKYAHSTPAYIMICKEEKWTELTCSTPAYMVMIMICKEENWIGLTLKSIVFCAPLIPCSQITVLRVCCVSRLHFDHQRKFVWLSDGVFLEMSCLMLCEVYVFWGTSINPMHSALLKEGTDFLCDLHTETLLQDHCLATEKYRCTW